MSLKILLADDHRIVLDGLRALIEKQPDMEVVAEAINGRSAVKLTRRLRPDVVVMDINMPDLNGIDATRQILAELPDTKVVAFSMHTDQQFVDGALKAGVAGYLQKDSAFAELDRAIRTVVSGQIYLSAKIAAGVFKGYVGKLMEEDTEDSATLTVREREVIQLYAEGRTTKEIAERLDLNFKTVQSHRRRIMEKLNISSIAELTKYTLREGITFVDR